MERQLRSDLHTPSGHDGEITPESPRRDIDVVLYHSPLLRIGRWRCPAAHPVFRDSGPVPETLFVFPRESVWIQHEGGRPFVADANTVTYYNAGQRYRRARLSAWGDRCEWFAFSLRAFAETLAAQEPACTGSHRSTVSLQPRSRRSRQLSAATTRRRTHQSRVPAGSLVCRGDDARCIQSRVRAGLSTSPRRIASRECWTARRRPGRGSARCDREAVSPGLVAGRHRRRHRHVGLPSRPHLPSSNCVLDASLPQSASYADRVGVATRPEHRSQSSGARPRVLEPQSFHRDVPARVRTDAVSIQTDAELQKLWLERRRNAEHSGSRSERLGSARSKCAAG